MIITRLSLIQILAITFLIVGCKSDKEATDVNMDVVLDVAVRKEPPKLSPYLYYASSSEKINKYIFSGMADYDPVTFELIPVLLTKIPEKQPITTGPYKGGVFFDLEFRSDAKWPDGSAVTGNDLLFSIKTIKHPGVQASGFRSYYQTVADIVVDAENPRKARIMMAKDYLLAQEASVAITIYPQYVYDPEGAMNEITIPELNNEERAQEIIDQKPELQEFASRFNDPTFARTTLVGAGPYEFAEWQPGQFIKLRKKKNFWAEGSDNPYLKAGAEEIVFHFIPEETAIIGQLKEGNIDLYDAASASAFQQLKTNETYEEDLEFYSPELMKFYLIFVNTLSPKLKSSKARRAVAHLIDVDEFIQELENGLGERVTSIFNNKKSYYNKELQPIPFDLDKAAALLAEDGWTDSDNDDVLDKIINGKQVAFSLDIHISGAKVGQTIALLLQENGKKVGVEVNIIKKPYKEIAKEHLSIQNYDLVPSSIGQSLAMDDPYSKWHSDNIGPSKFNYSAYASPVADRLIETIRNTTNAKERTEAYQELQRVMYEDMPLVFLYSPTEKIIVDEDWQGVITGQKPGYLANTFVYNPN